MKKLVLFVTLLGGDAKMCQSCAVVEDITCPASLGYEAYCGPNMGAVCDRDADCTYTFSHCAPSLFPLEPIDEDK